MVTTPKFHNQISPIASATLAPHAPSDLPLATLLCFRLRYHQIEPETDP